MNKNFSSKDCLNAWICFLIPIFVISVIYLASVGYFKLPDQVDHQSHLVDFDLKWYNITKKPIDQLSIEVTNTGEIVVVDIITQPYVMPNEFGMFYAPVERNLMDRILDGYTVINARRTE